MIDSPYWGTTRLSLLRDKLLVLIGGQITCSYWVKITWPYWGTNYLSLLREKLLVLIEGKTTCPYWRKNYLSLLREKLPVLISRDRLLVLIEGQTVWPLWSDHIRHQRLHLTFLRDSTLKMDIAWFFGTFGKTFFMFDSWYMSNYLSNRCSRVMDTCNIETLLSKLCQIAVEFPTDCSVQVWVISDFSSTMF